MAASELVPVQFLKTFEKGECTRRYNLVKIELKWLNLSNTFPHHYVRLFIIYIVNKWCK